MSYKLINNLLSEESILIKAKLLNILDKNNILSQKSYSFISSFCFSSEFRTKYKVMYIEWENDDCFRCDLTYSSCIMVSIKGSLKRQQFTIIKITEVCTRFLYRPSLEKKNEKLREIDISL